MCAPLRELKWFNTLPRQTHTLLLAFVTFLLGLFLAAYLISLASPRLCVCLHMGLCFLFPTIPSSLSHCSCSTLVLCNIKH